MLIKSIYSCFTSLRVGELTRRLSPSFIQYGDASTDIPDDIIHAVKLMVSHLYENREGVNISMTNASQIPMPDNVKQILGFYRVKHFG